VGGFCVSNIFEDASLSDSKVNHYVIRKALDCFQPSVRTKITKLQISINK
jgi:hypothetical protein